MRRPPLTDSLRVRDVLAGVHRITKRSPGKVTAYWYAWRGGPRILNVSAKSDAELTKAIARATPDACEAYKAASGRGGDSITLYGLITRYLTAMEALDLADRTKADRRKHLDKVRADIGRMELKAIDSKRARKVLVDWRNRYKATPKTADELLGALSKVIDWGIDQGDIHKNPVKDVASLYAPPDRSEIIWEPHHLEAIRPHCDERFWEFVQVATLTGLRLGDLRRLPWASVGEDAIVFQTGKSNKRRTVVVPMTEALRDVLDAIPRSPKSMTVLNSRRQLPWSEPGLESALQRARAASGIEGLRIHDMRGTAATHFIREGLDDRDIATVLGWEEKRVAEIRRRYVSGQEIGLAIARRLRQNKARAGSVNLSVNRA